MIIEDLKIISRLKNNNYIYNSFDNDVIAFFKEFSDIIFKNKSYRQHTDLISFALWARTENLKKLISNNQKQNVSKGKGLVFHVTPSNVPTNFVYSMAFGLLCGNSNIIKLPTKKFIQIELLTSIIFKILKKKKFNKLKKRIFLIRYDSDDIKISKYLSSISDSRMIWGSDETINFFKYLDTPLNCNDLFFYDRYSFSVICSKKLMQSKNEISKIVKNFYNDSLLFDQNACTTPHLIFWYGNKLENRKASKFFWENLNQLMKQKYEISSFKSIYKHSKFIFDTMNLKNIKEVSNFDQILTVVNIDKFDGDISILKSKFGYFYQLDLKSLNHLNRYLNPKVQTLLYYGLTESDLKSIEKDRNKKGMNRIAPLGKSMQINFKWDGYDIFNELTNTIEFIK